MLRGVMRKASEFYSEDISEWLNKFSRDEGR